MIDIISKLKRMIVEPKVYALMVTSARGQVLHLGVHFSLEEAYTAARKRMENLVPHKPGEAMDIDLWNTLPARHVINHMIESIDEDASPVSQEKDKPIENNVGGPLVEVEFGEVPKIIEDIIKNHMKHGDTLIDHVKDFRESKNHLMQKLIDDGDISAVERLKDLLGANSKRYVLNAIAKKNNQHVGPEKGPTEEKK